LQNYSGWANDNKGGEAETTGNLLATPKELSPEKSSTERATGVTGEAQGQGGPHVHFSEPLNRPQQISGLELKGSNKLPRVGQNKSEMKNFKSQSGSPPRNLFTKLRESARVTYDQTQGILRKKPNLEESARRVYDQSRLYHGTNLPSKESIRENGFNKDLKSGGASKELEDRLRDIPEDFEDLTSKYKGALNSAQNNNFFTSNKEGAKTYARKSLETGPAIARTLGIKESFSVHRDPDSDDHANQRTSSNIPPDYIVGSKKSGSSADGAIFQRELLRAGIPVSPQKAGELLREVQSDSDEDFAAET
jgi:type III effector protein AvrRpm1